MNLLIKGIEMPKGSSNLVKTAYPCDLVISKDGKHELVERGARYSCYEISTPHGRLIDADELIAQINKSLGDCHVIAIFEAIVNRQPTIIEAEE